jgi:hypothetical protein
MSKIIPAPQPPSRPPPQPPPGSKAASNEARARAANVSSILPAGGLVRAAELEARRLADHFESGPARHRRLNLFRDAVREVSHLRITGEVVEGEHHQQRYPWEIVVSPLARRLSA